MTGLVGLAGRGALANKLESLKRMTVIVADTGDLEAVRRLGPQDCTTNPSLLLKAASTADGQRILRDAMAWAEARGADAAGRTNLACDRFAVLTVRELSRIVPGLVSLEVDADLAFNADATVRKGETFLAMLEELGVPRDRVLIKVAATWEGIEATRRFQAAGINCNVTLVFSLAQAMAAAEAGAFLISPFVGRVTDWHVQRGEGPFTPYNDPGVALVRSIYAAVKASGARTVVMGASFRSTSQIEALAGCDRLTISPALLEALAREPGEMMRQLVRPARAPAAPSIDEAGFRRATEADPMASGKLADGIRQFAADLDALRARVSEAVAA